MLAVDARCGYDSLDQNRSLKILSATNNDECSFHMSRKNIYVCSKTSIQKTSAYGNKP